MKNLIILLLAFLPLTTFAQKEKLTQIFNQYENQEGVTSIHIAKPMFRMIDNLTIKDEEFSKVKPLLSKMNSIKILILESGAKENGSANFNTKKIGNDILTAVNKLSYEELMTVNSKDGKIKFLASNVKGNVLDNLLLTINSDDEQVLMMLDGSISMDDVSAIANESRKK